MMPATITDKPVLREETADQPAHRQKSLPHNFAWTLAGNLIYSASQWGIVVVLAKWGDTATVGQFALAVALTGPIMMLAGCALRTVQATDTTSDFTFGDYLGFRSLALGAALAAIAFLAVGVGESAAIVGVVLAVGLAKTFESLSDLFYGALQQREQMERIGKSMIVRGSFSLVAVAAAIWLARAGSATSLALVAALVLAACWGLALLAIDVRDARIHGGLSLRPRFDRRRLFKLAKLTAPLGITVVLGSLIINMPRYVIERYLGTEELGIYAALAYFALVGNLIANALANAVMPRLSRYWVQEDVRDFRRLLLNLLAMGVVFGAAGIALASLCGEAILTIAYRPEYARFNDVFLILMASTALSFQVCFLDTAIYASRCFRVHIPINAAVAVLVLAAAMAWVPRYGLHGAAWAACLATGVQAAARCAFMGWLLRRRRDVVAPQCSLSG